MIATTHDLTFDADLVTKRYLRTERGQHRSEAWALDLLAPRLPGVVPEVVARDLDAAPPWLRLTRLPGAPLGEAPLTEAQAAGVGDVLGRVLRAAPAHELDAVRPRGWDAATALAALRDWRPERPDPELEPEAARALETARAWLSTDLGHLEEPAQPVVARGDGNLANYLWDDEAARAVDFEDSGRSDLAYELADAVEHVSTWVHDVGAGTPSRVRLLDHVDTSDVDPGRLTDCRRLFATFWLLMLLPDGPAHRRNPEGTLRHGALRALDLLG